MIYYFIGYGCIKSYNHNYFKFNIFLKKKGFYKRVMEQKVTQTFEETKEMAETVDLTTISEHRLQQEIYSVYLARKFGLVASK